MAAACLLSARGERTRTPGDILCESLENLTQEDFKRFKDTLSDFSYEGRPPIPCGRLEEADCVETKNLLINDYGEETALDVTIQVCMSISLMGPAEVLQHYVTQHAFIFSAISQKRSSTTTLEDCRLRYMDHMREKYHVIKHHDKMFRKALNLGKGYTSLLLIKNQRTEEERQHEILSSGQRHLQIMTNRSSHEHSPTTIQTLFDPEEDGIIPKFVVLQGPAGIGKTMTSQKIMLDWASGNLYKDKFQFVFYMSCREVNTITGTISLDRYLSRYCLLKCPPEVLQSIFVKSEGILFIVDGFDELQWSSMNITEVIEDPFKEISKEILLNSLFRKTIFTESSLIITTRPLSLTKLTDFVECPRYVEILGFTGNERENYFSNFFKTKEQADLALNTIKDNDTLFTMCVVPIICWIVCTVMEPLLKEGLPLIDSKTSTSIYLVYLKGLIKYHGRKSDQSIITYIKKLCTLAIEGVWNRRILFEESDLVRHGLSMSELESVFLNENIFQRDIETCTCYSFIHLSVQEFFAALYYVLDEKSGKEPFIDLKIRKVKDLLKASEDYAHLKLTVRFLFGLSSEKQIQETLRSIGCTITFREKPVLEEWLKRNPSEYHNEILCCLYETQDKDYVERMMSHFPNVNITDHYCDKWIQYTIDYRVVAYCLHRSTIKHIVSFEFYTIGPKARNVLSKALSKCSILRFKACKFPVTEEEVNEDESSISGLFNQCQMQELQLDTCHLTSSCCDDLRSVLITPRSLIRLHLSWNNLQDSGIKLLCEGLRHPDCILQDLALQWCELTSSCCDDLRSVLNTLRSLIRLDLTENDLEDCGVKLLCEGLRHPDCIIQDLTLRGCRLTSSCCDDLRSVLITHRSLIRLDLSENNLQDPGLKLLCEGLRHPDCILQDLGLEDCDLTSSCCDDLRSVLITPRSLIKLDLSSNNLQDSGIQILCEGLRHPDCILQDLKIVYCGLTSSCCDDLRSVLITPRSLIRLDLSPNNLQDSGGIWSKTSGLCEAASAASGER
ncbi:NACHT, LRR and PYD domains-containing protein 3-like isoform X4 [Mixophyes fleayi]|uniref:NACHT, LRR and PYD domains-containing protein 3-like isoform X4 n=1 Tax=Mixophyes fleayi TaxID=3061075 RepID=UPI003F4D72A4